MKKKDSYKTIIKLSIFLYFQTLVKRILGLILKQEFLFCIFKADFPCHFISTSNDTKHILHHYMFFLLMK